MSESARRSRRVNSRAAPAEDDSGPNGAQVSPPASGPNGAQVSPPASGPNGAQVSSPAVRTPGSGGGSRAGRALAEAQAAAQLASALQRAEAAEAALVLQREAAQILADSNRAGTRLSPAVLDELDSNGIVTGAGAITWTKTPSAIEHYSTNVHPRPADAERQVYSYTIDAACDPHAAVLIAKVQAQEQSTKTHGRHRDVTALVQVLSYLSDVTDFLNSDRPPASIEEAHGDFLDAGAHLRAVMELVHLRLDEHNLMSSGRGGKAALSAMEGRHELSANSRLSARTQAILSYVDGKSRVSEINAHAKAGK